MNEANPVRYECYLSVPDRMKNDGSYIREPYYFTHMPSLEEIFALGARGMTYTHVVRPGDKVGTFYVMDPDGSLTLGTIPYAINVSRIQLPELLLD